jgi:hypothetical protein
MSMSCGNRAAKGQPGIAGMKVNELKELLRHHGLETSGRRADLCDRILDAHSQNLIDDDEVFGPNHSSANGYARSMSPSRRRTMSPSRRQTMSQSRRAMSPMRSGSRSSRRY